MSGFFLLCHLYFSFLGFGVLGSVSCRYFFFFCILHFAFCGERAASAVDAACLALLASCELVLSHFRRYVMLAS